MPEQVHRTPPFPRTVAYEPLTVSHVSELLLGALRDAGPWWLALSP